MAHLTPLSPNITIQPITFSKVILTLIISNTLVMHEYNNDLNSVRNIPYNVLRDVFIMSGTERGRRAVKGQSWNLILGHCSKDLYTWAGITLSVS